MNTVADLVLEAYDVFDGYLTQTANFTDKNVFTPLYWAVMEHDKSKYTKNISHAQLMVLGKIIEFCRKNGYCNASTETIAKQTHLEVITVKRAIVVLENHNYIDDLSPERHRKPHEYVASDTLKGILRKAGAKAYANG